MNPARSMPLNVLVLAVGGNVSQGILKALARSQLPVRVIGTDVSALQFGLFTVDRAYVSPWAHEPHFVDWVLEVCRREEVDVILSGCEPILRVLAPVRERVEQETGAVCFVNSIAITALGDDKLATCRWLEANGFNYPRYAAANDDAGLETLVAACGFPLLAKPVTMGGAVGVLEVAGPDDLAYVRRKPGYVVQELLGDPDSEYTVGVFCDRHGAVSGSIVMRRILHAGTTYRSTIGAFPDVRAEAERIAVRLEARGPCNVQLRMTPRGPVCFEINPRFSGTAPMRARFGFNEAEAVLRHFVLNEPDVHLPRVESGHCLRYWNELYVDDEAVETLLRDGRLDDPGRFPSDVEGYGARD